jgi:nucleoside-diphosphate-sugar epimerase
MLFANVCALHYLLESSKNIPYKAFINFSTSAIGLPVQSLYSTTKVMGEKLSTFYATMYSKPIVNVRPYSVTGVGEQEAHLIPTLIRAAHSEETVPFVPEPVHDYIDIEDLVRLVTYIIDNVDSVAPICHLGSSVSVSNADVLRIVEKVTGRNVSTKRVDSMRSYDSTDWVAPGSQLFEMKPLERSIREMVEVYKLNVDNVAKK